MFSHLVYNPDRSRLALPAVISYSGGKCSALLQTKTASVLTLLNIHGLCTVTETYFVGRAFPW